jgi:hypothetical protein
MAPAPPDDQRDLGSRCARKLDGRLERLVGTVKPGGGGAYLSSPGPDFEEAGTEQAISDLGHAGDPPATRTLDRFAEPDVDGAGRWSGDGEGQLDVTHGAPFWSHESRQLTWRNHGHSVVRFWRTRRFRALTTLVTRVCALPEARLGRA